MKKIALLVVLALLSGCGQRISPEAGAPTAPGLTLDNKAVAFDTVWLTHRDESLAAQWSAIRLRFSGDLPGFYENERFGDMAGFVDGVRSQKLAEWPVHREAALEAADRFVADFPVAVAKFEKEIGPLPAQRPVTLVMSLGEFDGAVRNLGQGDGLYFGADEIARIYPGASTAAFLQHELFHTYHSPRIGDCQPLWCALWGEGLAVYAASRLNPGANDVELGLTMPSPIRPALAHERARAICAIRQRLDGSEDYRPIFTGMGEPLDGLPLRFGYLVGLWVAEDLGAGRSLSAMAQWRGVELRDRIAASLDRMAECPPG